MSKQDYYQVLGVEKGADEAALKKAFRKKAMQYHPDRNPDDEVAERKFKELNEAYDVLKDNQKRAAYDRYGHDAFQNGMGGGAGSSRGGFHDFGQGMGGGAGGFEDIFEDLFGDVFSGARAGGQAGAARGSDLRYNLAISLEDAFNGKTVKVKIPTLAECGTCHGSGAEPGTKPTTCPSCGGSGEMRVTQGFFSMSRTCPRCHGRGTIVENPCNSCHGQGRVQKEKTINVKIPQGVDDGTRIRVSGEGEAGAHGGPAGDLYIFIQLKPHDIFTRDGRNLQLAMPLGFVDAALGGELEVPTPDGGRAKIAIPAGTQSGQTFRLRGKGMPVPGGTAFGDLHVTVDISVPSKLNKKQKELLEQLRDSLGDANTPHDSFMDKLNRYWKN